MGRDIEYVSYGSNNAQYQGPKKNQIGPGWPVTAALFSLALLMGFFDHEIGGWGETVTLAAAALVVPVFLPQVRKFWNQRQFWVSVGLLAVIQVPVVISVQRFLGRAGSFYVLAFGVADCVLVIAVIFFVCSQSSEQRR